MSIRHLERLLTPASLAVIGASDRPGSVGATVWRNLRSGGFRGPIFALNRRIAQLDGEPVFQSVSDLPQVPDLAVVCTPAPSIPRLVGQLGEHGTRAVIVATAGLDAAQKQAVLDAARPTLLRVLGPNCLGLLNPRMGLNASFAHIDAKPGRIAFVSQSGALITAVLDWAASRGIGFSTMVSLGEQADVDFGDLLDHLASDFHTRSILLYIESISETGKFMSAARAAARNKPVIVVKAGRAGHGLSAATSHTGALAGSDLVFDAAIRRGGMLRVDTLGDLFMAAETLARFGANTDDRLTLVTNGGGAGVLAADAAARAGVPMADLSDELRGKLSSFLPFNWSGGNPIDIIGDAPVERYTATLQAVLADRAAGAVLLMHAPTAIVKSEDIARACAPIVRQATDRVLGCWLGGDSVAGARHIFEDCGVATYDTPERAVRAFALLGTYRRNQQLMLEAPTASENGPPNLAAARQVIDEALAQGRDGIDEVQAKVLLRAYGIPVVETVRSEATVEAAIEAAERIGWPVALKILSPEISHKSDVGGVALDLPDVDALRSAARRMLDRVSRERPQALIDGFSVQKMARHRGAHELIAGIGIDPAFGPVILFGQGGTAVEVIGDRAMALPPLNRVLAREQIARTRVARLLAAHRGQPAADLDAIADTLIALSQMAADLPEIAELDINPLLADEHGVVALDARVRIDPEARGGARHFSIQPYPAELAETIDWHGESIVLRPIRPEDGPQHRAFAERLGAEDLRLRFFTTRRYLPPSELARLTQIDYAREMAFIAVRSSGPAGQAETLGVARAVTDPDNLEAEFAVIVRSDLKRRGLGRLLLRKLIDHLAARGTQRVVGHVLNDNVSMRSIVAAFGFRQRRTASDEDGASVWELDLSARATS